MKNPILYGKYMSPPVRSVLLVAKAINLDLEFRVVDYFAGEQFTAEFLAINPQHTVPTLDDNGNILWDSHAIVTYLVVKYGQDDSLYPKDPYKRALVDQRLHFDSEILFARMRGIFERIIFHNEPIIPQEKLDGLEEAYAFLNAFLAKDDYLVGTTPTVADFCSVSAVSSTQGVLPVDPDKYPSLLSWVKRMEELPYYEEMNGSYARELVAFVNNKRRDLLSS